MTVYAKLVAGRVRELTEKGEPVDLAVAASEGEHDLRLICAGCHLTLLETEHPE